MSRYFLFVFFLVTISWRLFAQTGKFVESFDKEEKLKWHFSSVTHKDSATFEVKDGSLIITNNQKKTAIVEFEPPYTGIDFGDHSEWEIVIHFRHLSGVENFSYGFCLGGKPDTYYEDGINFALSANGQYTVFNYFNKKYNQIEKWRSFTPIKKQNNEVNEVRIIRRSPWGWYLLINGYWAANRFGNGASGANLSFFVDGEQSIAIDDISIRSFKTMHNKLAKDRIPDFLEICMATADSFARAKAYPSENKYKTWLPELFICNRDYKIFLMKDGLFPKKAKNKSDRWVYSINTYFSTSEAREKQKKDLVDMITSVFKDYTTSSAKIDDKICTYFFSKNSSLPAGLMAIIEEYMYKESYQQEENFHIRIDVLSAPDLKKF